ncbi:MAG: family 78 glycoside hydrolase catalytic domain [bacterium]
MITLAMAFVLLLPQAIAPGTDAPAFALAQIAVARPRTDLRFNPLQVEVAAPRLSWELVATDRSVRGQRQTAFEVIVASSREAQTSGRADLWSSGVVRSDASHITYGGPPLASLARAFWKVRVSDRDGRLSAWSELAEWTQGFTAPAAWGAQWITGRGTEAPLPLFRREFRVTRRVARALVSICGLGQYELRVNGANVSDGVLDPGWTDFSKTCLYRTFDVTPRLSRGENTLGVLLGNGMYHVPKTEGRYTKFTGSFGAPKLIARLSIVYADGTQFDVVSDTTWKTASGPITFTNIYGGEDYDARLEQDGWDRADFDDAGWTHAAIVPDAGPALVAQAEPPVTIVEHMPTVRITEPAPGVFVYDLGKNFSGWPEIEVAGLRGATVRLIGGELLDDKGMVTLSSMNGGPVWNDYTLRGGATERWHPRFTYSGLRYVQVTGAVPAEHAARFPDRPRVRRLSGEFISTSAERVGTFTTSDRDINAIHANILGAIRSNLLSILTDCPHREKLGWLEVSHLLARGMMYNLDLHAFYEQAAEKMRLAQTPSGLVPNIVPEYTVFTDAFRDSPEWGSAYIANPWHVYEMYGDASLVARHYAGMSRYLDYLLGKSANGLLAYGLGDWYDAGPKPPGYSQLTSSGVTATGTLFMDATIMRRAATLLGYSADAARFDSLAQSSARAYHERFWNPAGYYDRNSQTANGLPLGLGVVPSSVRGEVLNALVAAFEATDYRVTSGETGFPFVISALSDNGRADVLMRVLRQRRAGGYLYQVDHGATTLTEAWDAYSRSSQNQAMFGHIERWFWEGLAGINPDSAGPGFGRFAIRPQFVDGLDSVSAAYHTTHGLIETSWTKRRGMVTMRVSVPVNTIATIYLPTGTVEAITEGGVAVRRARGVTAVHVSGDRVAVEAGSGHYQFVIAR